MNYEDFTLGYILGYNNGKSSGGGGIPISYDDIKIVKSWKIKGTDFGVCFLDPFQPFLVCGAYVYSTYNEGESNESHKLEITYRLASGITEGGKLKFVIPQVAVNSTGKYNVSEFYHRYSNGSIQRVNWYDISGAEATYTYSESSKRASISLRGQMFRKYLDGEYRDAVGNVYYNDEIITGSLYTTTNCYALSLKYSENLQRFQFYRSDWNKMRNALTSSVTDNYMYPFFPCTKFEDIAESAMFGKRFLDAIASFGTTIELEEV